jgi:acetyl esterase
LKIFSKEAAQPFFDAIKNVTSIPEQWLKIFREKHSVIDSEELSQFPDVVKRVQNCRGRDGHNIPLVIFEPANPVAKTFIYIHGGGFVSPLNGRHMAWAIHIAAQANIQVVCIEHRLAPEHPFPSALYDCVDTYQYFRKHSHHEIIVGGDSSGGNLALALGMYCVQNQILLPDKIIAMCAVMDLHFEKHKSMLNAGIDNMNIPHLFLAMGAFQRACYAPNIADWTNPLVSPFYGDLARMPKTLVVSAGEDYCYDDNIAFANKMKNDGGEVVLQNYEGMPHSFFTYSKLLPKQSDVANADIIKFILS